MTRPKFEYLCFDLFKRCIPPLENALKDAKMNKNQIDKIVLIGGSTRIPKIQALIKEFFNGKEPLKNIIPDEAVAYGEAIQAAIMTNVKDEKIEKLILLNGIPFSLGIEIPGGAMEVLIQRNSLIPCKKSKIFSTCSDNQSDFLVQIYEGDKPLAKDNNLLGKLYLDGIPPMPKGQPQIEVTFDIDANSIINVSVKEKSIGKNNKMVITNDKGRLSKDVIKRLVLEAEKFKGEDNLIKERIEAKINLEDYYYNIRITLKDDKLKDKFTEELKNDIENIIEEILKWDNDNPGASKEEYETKIREIESVFDPIMNKIYQQSGGTIFRMPGY